MKLDPYLIADKDLKWFKDLNVRPETINFLEESPSSALWSEARERLPRIKDVTVKLSLAFKVILCRVTVLR